MLTKLRHKLGVVGAALVAALAPAARAEYAVPAGVTTAIADAKEAATGLANAAIPAVAGIALAFVGISVIWLIVRSLRRAAR